MALEFLSRPSAMASLLAEGDCSALRRRRQTAARFLVSVSVDLKFPEVALRSPRFGHITIPQLRYPAEFLLRSSDSPIRRCASTVSIFLESGLKRFLGRQRLAVLNASTTKVYVWTGSVPRAPKRPRQCRASVRECFWVSCPTSGIVLHIRRWIDVLLF
jgi:hypothetical protein